MTFIDKGIKGILERRYKMEDPKLIPLRIPAGFAVCYNKFYDVEPTESKTTEDFLENWGYFTEDILQIIKMDLIKGHWQITEPHLIIDLGWYPDSSPKGAYVLYLAVVKEDHDWAVIEQIRSRDRMKIRETIEKWMEDIIQQRITYDKNTNIK